MAKTRVDYRLHEEVILAIKRISKYYGIKDTAAVEKAIVELDGRIGKELNAADLSKQRELWGNESMIEADKPPRVRVTVRAGEVIQPSPCVDWGFDQGAQTSVRLAHFNPYNDPCSGEILALGLRDRPHCIVCGTEFTTEQVRAGQRLLAEASRLAQSDPFPDPEPNPFDEPGELIATTVYNRDEQTVIVRREPFDEDAAAQAARERLIAAAENMPKEFEPPSELEGIIKRGSNERTPVEENE